MKHHVLQNMIMSPRDSSYDPRIAQTGTTKRSVGADGMLYANLSGSNDQKYKMMSESELMDEMRRSQEIKEAMIGSGKQSRQTRPHSSSITGTTVRSPAHRETKRSYSRSPVSNRSLQRNYEADDSDYYSSRLPEYSEASGEFSREEQMQRGRSFRSSADNQDDLRHSEHDIMRNSGSGIASDRNRNHDSKTNMSTARYENENEEDRERPHANSMIDALKLKYEQNLDVIERLFDEKSSMEKLVRSLDSQLSMAKKELASPKYSDRVVYGASSSGNFSEPKEENVDILRRGTHLEEEDANAMRDYDLEFSRSSRPVPGERTYNSLPVPGERTHNSLPVPGERTYNSLPPRDYSRSLSVARMSREYLEEESRRSRDAYQGDVTYDLRGSQASGMARPSSAFSRHSDGHQAWNSSCHIRDSNPFYSLESRERSPSPSPRDRERDRERARSRGSDRGSDRGSYRDRDRDRESNSSRGRERSHTPTSPHAYSIRSRDRRGSDDHDVENLGPRSRTRSFSARSSRSRSHSRSFSTEPRLSSNLQADQDRYVQRRRAFEDREKERIADQKKFEESLIDRSVRASRNGGEFTEMIKRDALARERAESKRKEKEEKEAREAIEEQEAKNKQRKFLLERSRPKEAMTWAEMQEVQERTREERIALRVVEMSSRIGFEPSKSSEGIARQTARSKLSPAPDAPAPVEDPKAVLTRLEKQRRDWDRKLDRIRTLDLHSRNEANKEVKQKASQMGTTAALGDKLFHGTASMVQRALEFEEKKINKLNEKIKKELDEKEKKIELEKKQREKIVNSKVPEEGRRLTKSVEIRANMVRGSLEEKEAAKAKEAARLNKKKLAEKQHGEVLRTLLLERERDRKMNHGGFVELNKSQAEIDAIAAENRERFRTRLRENRRKIEMAAEARPSLLIRHDQAVARSMAASSALQKVAQAVVGGKLSGGQRTGTGSKSEQAAVRSALNEDDIFDENQKILLGYQDDFLDN